MFGLKLCFKLKTIFSFLHIGLKCIDIRPSRCIIQGCITINHYLKIIDADVTIIVLIKVVSSAYRIICDLAAIDKSWKYVVFRKRRMKYLLCAYLVKWWQLFIQIILPFLITCLKVTSYEGLLLFTEYYQD